jgi:hypothetical protein
MRTRIELLVALEKLKAEQAKVEAVLEKLNQADPWSLETLVSTKKISESLFRLLCAKGYHDLLELKDLPYEEIYQLTRNACHTRKLWKLLESV